MFRTMYI